MKPKAALRGRRVGISGLLNVFDEVYDRSSYLSFGYKATVGRHTFLLEFFLSCLTLLFKTQLVLAFVKNVSVCTMSSKLLIQNAFISSHDLDFCHIQLNSD